MFVHGGGFIGGDKHVPGSPMYDHVGAWAVRNGWVGVTITYRLAPEHTWPSGAQDVAAAAAWVRDNIASYGGDPSRIVVAGHSAGCVHVASYLAGQEAGTAAARSTASGAAPCSPASTRSPTPPSGAGLSSPTSATGRPPRSTRCPGCSTARSR